MIQTTFYKDFSERGTDVNLINVLKSIKNGDFKEEIDELRYNRNDEIRFGELKKQLPHITPSGTFADRRKCENLCNYNGIMVLDIDKVGENATHVRNSAAKIEYSFAAFVSPSGSGVKVFVKTDATPQNHEQIFNYLSDFYEVELSVSIDRTGKDLTRACFISYDQDLYLNQDSKIFLRSSMTPRVAFSVPNSTKDPNFDFNHILNFTEKSNKYFSGNRNNFIYMLSNNFNRGGILMEDALKFIYNKYTDPDITREIPQIVKSAYSNVNEHGIFGTGYFSTVSFASFATTTKCKMGVGTSKVPDVVYENLPQFLKECTSVFKVPRERDMFLFAALSILSGCFNNVGGLYAQSYYSPNLYCFIISIPGSGKYVLIFARQLGEFIHEMRISDKEPTTYSTELNKINSFFIPANSSSAAVGRMLSRNYGQGVICETEADTLSSTMAQDWGAYDDLLRKAFQHEPVTSSRINKENDDVILHEIKHPKLSICLTGTPNQVGTLLKSTENGLFSRFMFYTFQNEGIPEFKDVFSENGINNLEKFFTEKSIELYELSQRIVMVGEIEFNLCKNQSDEFLKYFDSKLKQLHELYGNETNAIVYRLGLITFRIAMLLSIFRVLAENNVSNKILCKDADFQSSLILSEILLEHSLAVFSTLPGSKAPNQNAIKFLDFLPVEFTFSTAEKIGKIYCNFSSRSVSNYLKELIGNNLIFQKNKNGMYFRPVEQ